MINRQHNELIGLGVYTLQEASLYGLLSSNKLSRWVFGTNKYPPVIESQLSSQRLVSFYDLVQAMAINTAREHGISLHKIRKAINNAKSYGIELPLAYNHKLILFANNLYILFPNQTMTQVTGQPIGQTAMVPIAEPFMQDLHFDPEGLAKLFTPFAKYGRQIILDPQRQFGHPLVGETGYRADVLDKAFSIEKSTEFVASAYNIDVKDIKAAVAYMKYLRMRRAA